MKPDEYIDDKPKNHFEWGYLYKVYLVILIAVFLLALANQANAGVFLEINGNMDYYDSQLPFGDIMQNSDTWDAVAGYMNDVHGVPFPSYSEATQMDDLLENVLMYYVGQYCNLSGTAAQQVYDACMDVADAANTVWDLISLDLESGDFVVAPNKEGDLSDVIHGVVDPLIYSSAGVETIGHFLPLPIEAPNGDHLYNMVSSGIDPSAQIWAAMGGNTLVLCSLQSSNAKAWTHDGNIANYAVSGNYVGTVRNGFYRLQSSNSYLSSIMSYLTSGGFSYQTTTDALDDFFGGEFISGDVSLNGNGYIINENPTFAPLSGYSALNYPYRTKIVDNHTNTTDPDDPVEYPSGVNTVEPSPVYKDVPTWLVDPTVDIPEEPDYLENVDVELPEIEPDTGFITDCYNALPSGIVSMIAVGLGLGVVMKIIS